MPCTPACDAWEIRKRAERRLYELKKAEGLKKPEAVKGQRGFLGKPRKLADADIDKNLLNRINAVGEIMAEEPKAKGAKEPGTKRGATRVLGKPTSLADQGIDKNLANRARPSISFRK